MPDEKLRVLSEQETKWHSMAQVFQKRWEPVPKRKANLNALVLESEGLYRGQRTVEKVRSLARITLV